MRRPSSIEISHPDKVLYPRSGSRPPVTKRDLVDYYREVAPVMLRHLADRPLMLERYPRGIEEHGFVQKEMGQVLPGWADRVEVAKEGGRLTHAVAGHVRDLAWLANQDVTTIHAFLSRRPRLERADLLVVDLDPPGEGHFDLVRETARRVRAALDDLGLPSYVQTTGSRGLHVVVPLRAEEGFDEVRSFGRDLAAHLAGKDPDRLTVQARKEKRAERLYLDVMRNGYAQTFVAPYAVRARPGAPVATPLAWDEVDDATLRPDGFTLADVLRRVADNGDPWAEMGRHRRSLARPRAALARIDGSSG